MCLFLRGAEEDRRAGEVLGGAREEEDLHLRTGPIKLLVYVLIVVYYYI